jgi:hypothetical protein
MDSDAMAAVAGGRGSVLTLAEIFSASPDVDREAVGVEFLRAAQFLLRTQSLDERLAAVRRFASAETRAGRVRYVFPRDSEWAIADALPRSPMDELSGHKSGGFQLPDVGPRAHVGGPGHRRH